MTIATARRLACSVALLSALGPARSLHAQLGVGTWVRKATDSTPPMTMTVEVCCNGGRRLTYQFDINGTATTLLVESPFDGSDAPVLIAGKPSGETMGITRVDDHHTPDGRLLTVINDFSSSAGGQLVGKYTETWVRQ